MRMQLNNRRAAVRPFLCFVLLVVALLLLPRPAFAEDRVEVEYDSSEDRVSFESFSDELPDEFFSAYRNLMPGDDRTQLLDVSVRNNASRVRVYFKLETRQEDEALLSPLTFALRSSDGTEFGAGSLTSVFHDWTLIATFDEPGEERFELFLSVPTSVGNEAAGIERELIAHIRFEDESPETETGSPSEKRETEWSSAEPSASESSWTGVPDLIGQATGRLAQTGDDAPEWLLPAAAVGIALVVGGLILRRKHES